jgi:hypothetical protein
MGTTRVAVDMGAVVVMVAGVVAGGDTATAAPRCQTTRTGFTAAAVTRRVRAVGSSGWVNAGPGMVMGVAWRLHRMPTTGAQAAATATATASVVVVVAVLHLTPPAVAPRPPACL